MTTTSARRVPGGKKAQVSRVPPFLPPLLALAICVGLLGASIAGAFRVRQIDVVGTNLPRQAIIQKANITGQNVFEVRSDQVVRHLGRLHEIIVSRVETSFPDRVDIYARLRVPMVAWQNGKALYELDPEGNVIRRVSATKLPIITGMQVRDLGPGVVQAVRYAVEKLPAVPLGDATVFRFQPSTGLTIVGRAGWTAIIGSGSAQTLVARIATLAALLVKIRNRPQRLQFVDLHSGQPYLQFAPS